MGNFIEENGGYKYWGMVGVVILNVGIAIAGIPIGAPWQTIVGTIMAGVAYGIFAVTRTVTERGYAAQVSYETTVTANTSTAKTVEKIAGFGDGGAQEE